MTAGKKYTTEHRREKNKIRKIEKYLKHNSNDLEAPKHIIPIVRKKRWFFALCRELGYNVEKSKERAKKKFNLPSFSDVLEHQLDYLIDLLLIKRDEKESEKT